MSLKRQEEDRVEREKQAAAAREAQAKADAEAQTERRAQAETERASAEQAKAEAERAKQESDLAAQKAAQEKQAAQTAQAAALAQQQALQAENEKARSQAEEAEYGRQMAESDKAEMRARLLQQLNAVLATRDTARGLIATMPDVLFETNRYALRPLPARVSRRLPASCSLIPTCGLRWMDTPIVWAAMRTINSSQKNEPHPRLLGTAGYRDCLCHCPGIRQDSTRRLECYRLGSSTESQS